MRDAAIRNEGAGEAEVLKFSVCDKPYAIDVKTVREILQIEKVCAVPNTTAAISGMALVRGEVVTIIDLAYPLEKKQTAGEHQRTTLLCEIGTLKIGFMVDAVLGIQRVSCDQIKEPNHMLNTDLISGNITVDNEIVMILDVENIIKRCMMA